MRFFFWLPSLMCAVKVAGAITRKKAHSLTKQLRTPEILMRISHFLSRWLGKIWGRYLSKDFLDRILVDCPFSMLKDKRLPQQMNLLHFRKKLPPIFNLKQKFSFLRTLWVDLKIRYAVAGSSRNSVYTYRYIYFFARKTFKTFKVSLLLWYY